MVENQFAQKKGVLYVVATPIGNLEDITQRALGLLKTVDMVAAEDTRRTKKLLSHFKMKKRVFSLHNYNEGERAHLVVEHILSGRSIALVSDSGTPLISDPGYRAVNCCLQAGIDVVPLPGACAAVAALSASGLPSDRFIFNGFFPPKRQSRIDRLSEIAMEKHTCIFYESPHRIMQTLLDMLGILGPEREVVIARELTKTFETIKRMHLGGLVTWMREESNRRRGEIVVLIHGYRQPSNKALSPESIQAMSALIKVMPLKKAATLVAELCHLEKNSLYRWGIKHLENQKMNVGQALR